MADDGIYTYSQDIPAEYIATIGNGHRGTIKEGDNQGMNTLRVSVSPLVDGDVRDFTATAIRNQQSRRKAVLTIEVRQLMDGAPTNVQSFSTDEQDFDGSGRAFLDFSLMFEKKAG